MDQRWESSGHLKGLLRKILSLNPHLGRFEKRRRKTPFLSPTPTWRRRRRPTTVLAPVPHPSPRSPNPSPSDNESEAVVALAPCYGIWRGQHHGLALAAVAAAPHDGHHSVGATTTTTTGRLTKLIAEDHMSMHGLGFRKLWLWPDLQREQTKSIPGQD